MTDDPNTQGATEARTPNRIDLHVGGRIRMRRKLLGVSQEKLADDLGLTFQQVQKYERGANRVSASKLYEIATSLQTSISFFFEGLPDTVDGAGVDQFDDQSRIMDMFIASEDGVTLARIFPRISRRLRRRALDLLMAMAETENGQGGEAPAADANDRGERVAHAA